MSGTIPLNTLVEKSLPLQAKMLLAGASSLMGCSGSPTQADTTPRYEVQPQRKSYQQGEQVCYGDDADPKWITLMEDVSPRSQAVLAKRPDGKMFYATVDYIIPPDACKK